MNEKESADLYGTFIALVFLTPFVGGLLADRLLGYSRSIYIGGALMGIGYCSMAVHSLPMLYFSMTCVIVGNGFFKPNISTLLGNLYNEEKYKARKDAGYSLFYMGINIGAFVCNFFGAALYNLIGWGAAFTAAGVGMFAAIIIFYLGTKHVKHADVRKPVLPGDMPLGQITGFILIPAVIFGVIGWLIPGHLVSSDSTDAFIFGCIPVLFFYGRILKGVPKEEKRPIGAMLTIFAISISFWAVFKQNGSTLNTWADRYTDREIPAAARPVMSSLFLVDSIKYEKKLIHPTDAQFRETGKEEIIAYPDYFKNQPDNQLPGNNQTLFAFNTNLFQSVNPFWVILLTPLIVGFFAFLRYRKLEPSTPAKMVLGLTFTALSCIVMVLAVNAGANGEVKASPWWFIGSYGVLTIGELMLSPMGLSLVSRLSPPRLTAVMMGGWFLATSIGNKMSGVLSTMWDGYDNKANFFWVDCFLLLGAAGILLLVLPWLNRVFREYSGLTLEHTSTHTSPDDENIIDKDI